MKVANYGVRIIFLQLLLFTFVNSTKAAGFTVDSVRLFTIGNSFSQNTTKYLPRIAEEMGKELTIGRAVIGGSSLQRHWLAAEAYEANPDDPVGKPYNGKSLKTLLSEGTWDIVTMQQYSLHSSYVDTYRPYAQKLYNYIKSIQPTAEVVLHQTWAYRLDAKIFGLIDEGVHATNQHEMWQKSRAAYHRIARELNVRILPVGDAFQEVSSDKNWNYKPDSNYDNDNAGKFAVPEQLNSLYVGYYRNKEDKLSADYKHANVAGEYLGALVWFGCLFKESPGGVKFVPDGVPDDFAKYLRKVAHKVVVKARRFR